MNQNLLENQRLLPEKRWCLDLPFQHEYLLPEDPAQFQLQMRLTAEREGQSLMDQSDLLGNLMDREI